jgi:hypothetical protein
MSILNVNQIQPVGGGNTITVSASDISASGTTITATSFIGPLTGAVTGNVTGNLTGNVTGNVTSSSTSTFSSGINVTGGRVLVGTTDAGSNGTADDLVVANNSSASDQAGISIRGGTSGRSQIFFSDGTSGQDEYRGMLRYDHSENSMQFRTDAAERMRIDSTGRLLKSGQAALNSTSLSHPIQVASASDANAIAIIGRAADDIGELSFYEADKSTKLGELQYRQDHLNFRHRVGDIRFATGGVTERLRITSAGNVQITDGNLVLASGHGIDFSATSNGGTSTPSELLDDYEEGSWSPQILGWNGSYSIQEGRYIKIGRMVHLIGEVRSDANVGNSFTNSWPGLSNLPFVNTTSFQGVSGSQRCMGYATILGSVSPGGTNGQGFVTFDRNDGTSFFPNNISSAGAQNFQNTMINNATTVDFGYRFNCTYYTD